MEDGLERYLGNKERARELNEKVQRTDELIDRIVYWLSGLTEKEIRVVEGAVGAESWVRDESSWSHGAERRTPAVESDRRRRGRELGMGRTSGNGR